jgi:hypothetical protein
MVTNRIHRTEMKPDLELLVLLERAKSHIMTADEREAQRRSFAYGNMAFDADITREDIDRAAEEM